MMENQGHLIAKNKNKWFLSLCSQGLRRTVKEKKVGKTRSWRVLNFGENGESLNISEKRVKLYLKNPIFLKFL